VSQQSRRSRFHCFEVRSDGSIVKPVLRPHDPNDCHAETLATPQVTAALFDGAAGSRDRAVLTLIDCL
jgi:hypothetical protein